MGDKEEKSEEKEKEVKERVKGRAKLTRGCGGAGLRVCFMIYLFFGLIMTTVLGTLYRGRLECYPKAIPTSIQE